MLNSVTFCRVTLNLKKICTTISFNISDTDKTTFVPLPLINLLTYDFGTWMHPDFSAMPIYVYVNNHTSTAPFPANLMINSHYYTGLGASNPSFSKHIWFSYFSLNSSFDFQNYLWNSFQLLRQSTSSSLLQIALLPDCAIQAQYFGSGKS